MKKCNCNNYPAVWTTKGWQCRNCWKINKCKVKHTKGVPCCPEYPHKEDLTFFINHKLEHSDFQCGTCKLKRELDKLSRKELQDMFIKKFKKELCKQEK